MESFFHRLYRYKQSDFRHQKENFLTEILAHCLDSDKIFQSEFLSLVNFNQEIKTFECQTQTIDKEFGKPDIFITINNNTTVVIECKVDATQEVTQLKRYADFLIKNKSKYKHLIFLTKYFEEVEAFPNSISFTHIRWYQIFDILPKSSDKISKELYKYLIEEKMSSKISFNKLDLNAIKNIQETLAKMREFLVRTKDILYSYTKSKVRVLQQIEKRNYGVSTDFHGGTLWLGFYQYEDNEEIHIGISIEDVPIENSDFDKLNEFSKVSNWTFYDNENNDKRTWYNSERLSSFFENDMFNTNKAHDFLEIELSKLMKWF